MVALSNLLSGFMHPRAGQSSSSVTDQTHALLLHADEIAELRQRCMARLSQQAAQRETSQPQHGEVPSRFRGYGLDYLESRHYQVGDEPRHMNWQLTARTGDLYMKVYEEERRPGVFILLDRRAAMRFGTHSRLKITQAARAATCIAFSAQQRHFSIAGLTLEANCHWIEQGNTSDAMPLIQAAIAPAPPMQWKEAGQQARLSYAFNLLRTALPGGSMVYLISDFMDLDETDRASLLQLAAKNQLHAIHIYDVAEKALPRSGVLRFLKKREKAYLNLDTLSPRTRNAFAHFADEHFSSCRELFKSLGISYTEISTQCEPIEDHIPLV